MTLHTSKVDGSIMCPPYLAGFPALVLVEPCWGVLFEVRKPPCAVFDGLTEEVAF